jgi:hypothetical protein
VRLAGFGSGWTARRWSSDADQLVVAVSRRRAGRAGRDQSAMRSGRASGRDRAIVKSTYNFPQAAALGCLRGLDGRRSSGGMDQTTLGGNIVATPRTHGAPLVRRRRRRPPRRSGGRLAPPRQAQRGGKSRRADARRPPAALIIGSKGPLSKPQRPLSFSGGNWSLCPLRDFPGRANKRPHRVEGCRSPKPRQRWALSLLGGKVPGAARVSTMVQSGWLGMASRECLPTNDDPRFIIGGKVS